MRKSSFLQYRIISCVLPMVLMLLAVNSLHAQRQRKVTNVNISPQIKQYLEHLPPGYNDPANATKKYPLIIYWHGLYEATSYTGGSLDPLFTKGLPQKIESYVFPDVVTYGGTNYSYIVMTPQYTNGGAGAYDVDAAINYFINNYRVDPARIYMTGISKGAGMCFAYPNAGLNFANKVAAVAPLAACEALTWDGATNVVNAKMRIWALHCPEDNICNAGTSLGSVINVNTQSPNPPLLAYYTATPAWSPTYPHDIFWIPYEPSYSAPESGGKNMYDWFIQFSKTGAPPPPPPSNIAPVANAGANQSIQLPASSVNLNGSGSTDADGSITGYAWTKVSGPASSTIANANAVTTSVSNLTEGVYTFKLVVTDNKGATGEATVVITVQAAPPPPPPSGSPNCSTISVIPGAGNIKLKGLISPVVTVHIFNSSWATVYNEAFTNSPDSINVPSLPVGTYFVKVNFYTAGWAFICEKSQNAEVGSAPPPPPPPPPPSGTPNCSNVTITAGAGALNLKGLISPVVSVHVFNSNWSTAYTNTFTNSPDNLTIPLAVGTYQVKVSFYNASWSFICDKMLDGSVTTPATTPPITTAARTETASMFEAVPDRIAAVTARFMTAVPNPFSKTIQVSIGSKNNENATIIIMDMTGRTLQKTSVALQKGVNRFSLDGSRYKAGSYYLRLITADGVQNLKLIKQ